MAEDENVKAVADETKKQSASIKELIKQMSSESAKSRKAEKTSIENERSKLDRLAKEIQAQGGRVEDNATYQREELLLKKRELELTAKSTPYFSEARKSLKSEAKQAKIQARNTTFLGKTLNKLTGNSAGASASKESQKDEARANEKQTTILGKIAGGIGGLLQSGKDAAKKVGKTGLDILKGTALAALYLGIAMFLKSPYFAQAVDFLEKDVMPLLKSFYENVLKPIGSVLKDVFFKQWENIKVLFDDLGTAIEQFKSGDILGGITTLITGIGSFFLKTVDNLITGVYNIFAKMFGLEETDSVGGSISKFFTDIKDKVFGFFVNLKDKISGYITGVYDSVSKFVTEKIDAIFNSIKGIVTTIKEFFSTRIDTAIETITQDFNEVLFFITNLQVFKFFKEALGDVIESIKGIFSGDFSMENLLQGGKGLFDLVTYPLNLAINAIKDIFGLGKDDSDFGKNEPFRLSEFIGGIITDSIKAITDWFGSLKIPSISELVTGGLNALKGIFSSKGNADEDKLKKELDEIYAKQSDARNLKLTSKEKQELKEREQEIKRILAGKQEIESNFAKSQKKLDKFQEKGLEKFIADREKENTGKISLKGVEIKEMSPEQLNEAISRYTERRNSIKGEVGKSVFDESNRKTSKALNARRKELMEPKTPKIERLDLSGIKKPEQTDAKFNVVREKPSAEIIENRKKAGLDVGGKFDYDVIKKVPAEKSGGAPVVINAPTNAPVNNNSNSTTVTSSNFVEPDPFFRRNAEFAL